MEKVRGYSIWLLPDPTVSVVLEEIIQQFSQICRTPEFAPHVTLVGQITDQREGIMDGFRILADSMDALPVTLHDPGMQDHFFRSLYLNVSPRAPLESVYNQALSFFNLDRDRGSYLPHLSLLYSHLESSRKQTLLNAYPSPMTFQTNLASIVLVKTEGPPDQWEQIEQIEI